MSEKFAFESGEVSIAFTPLVGLGDVIIAKKVFETIVDLCPNCKVDIFYTNEFIKTYVKAFYTQSKNLNAVFDSDKFPITTKT